MIKIKTLANWISLDQKCSEQALLSRLIDPLQYNGTRKNTRKS